LGSELTFAVSIGRPHCIALAQYVEHVHRELQVLPKQFGGKAELIPMPESKAALLAKQH
jgi:pyrimidine operon attenuation protein/uracil phosphoribosyltransferase